MTIRNAVLPILDVWRGRLDTVFGLRRYDVALLMREWPAGTIPGAHGVSPTETTIPLLVGGGRPRIEQISTREIAASGGLYQDRDIRIGPFTPPFMSGGADPEWLRPSVSADRVEYYIAISNADSGEAGERYSIVQTDTSRSLRWTMVCRKLGH